jgi:signal transduction histidine kinase
VEEELILPAILVPDRRQKRRVLLAALLVPVPFLVIIPFGTMQLPPVDAYIPVVDTVMFINDAIAATLLFAQFSIMRSPSMLALAGGFLLTAFLVVPHALSFPGAFAPDGLLGGGAQTPAWLNEFWFLGLPAAVIAYVLLKRAEPVPRDAVGFAIFATVAAAFVLTCALVWLSTAGAWLLPPIMSDDKVHPVLAWHFVPLVIFDGLAMALLWSRRYSSLDLWLMVVLEAWMLNALLFNKLVLRWSLFWYCGRVFAAVATSIVLLFLLSQTTLLYWRLARSHILLERERDNRMMNAEAITAAIAHEIRQPLTAIAANAGAARQFLGRMPPDPGEALSALDEVINESHRAGEVFEGIRALFRKSDQARQRIDLNEVAHDVLQSLRAELDQHGVTARPDLASDLPLIDGNKGQLQEVMLNLIHNAVEAMDAVTGRDRLLQVRTERYGRHAIAVAVQDSGPGIDPGKVDGIFDAFVTSKAGGMGLGLAICRMIIERHGGQLTASSDSKTGALFRFVLPVEQTDEAAMAAQ